MSKSIDECVLACSGDVQRVSEFFDRYRHVVGNDFRSIYLDYMRIYRNVMEKYPNESMEWRKNQTYSQLTNLYEVKKTLVNIVESKK